MRRSGHSLAELIVAMAVLGGSLTGMTAIAVVGSRRTEQAITLQRAVMLAGAVLDSLAGVSDPPFPGRREEGPPALVARWEVEPGDAGAMTLWVRVGRDDDSDPLVELAGVWLATPPGPIP